ncbi:MAG: hypothetical protein HY421_02900 [Candidatus Kerfeldbacteria bacterium]|nr:hypothetical protein [Candidatus Kerfeldbacteria bacterium]
MSEQSSTSGQKSILERVLSSQHAQAIEGFDPMAGFSVLVRGLTEKEQAVLRQRIGLDGQAPKTLEEIGQQFRVTRERIRQIENGAVHKIRRSRQFKETIGPIERLLMSILNQRGGIMEEQSFFLEVLSHAGSAPEQRRALSFILEQLLSHRLEHRPPGNGFRASWKLKAQSLELARQAIEALTSGVRQAAVPLTREQLLAAFRKLPLYQQHQTWFTEEAVLSYVGLSAQLGKNPFGEYGLTAWGTIVPKRMHDRILLIMRKHGQPLHFTEISKRINEAGFDARPAYPPTVHNELILNSEYVLIGRGIYALKEWGYKPGVVAEVLVELLRNADQPMSRDELIDAVLKQRMVKRNTVMLALTNKKLFRRLPSGEYELATQT